MSEDEWSEVGEKKLRAWEESNATRSPLTWAEKSAFYYAWDLAWEEIAKMNG